jgi:hypothetical protein
LASVGDLTSAEQSAALDPRVGAQTLSFPPVIGFLLVVQVPEASDVSRMTVLLRPLDRFMLRLTRGKDAVSVILNYVVGNVSALLPTLGSLEAANLRPWQEILTFQKAFAVTPITIKGIPVE